MPFLVDAFNSIGALYYGQKVGVAIKEGIMFQAELYTMTRREQLRDLVRDAARRQQAKEAGSSHSLGIVKHALIVLPLFVAIAGAVVTYLL